MRRSNNADYDPGFDAMMPAGAPPPNKNPQSAYRNTADSVQSFTHDLQGYQQSLNKVLDHINTMATEVYSLRRHYEDVNNEKLYLDGLVTQAEERMTNVKSIIERYTAVEDAVVASDGYTYEREMITNYINTCIQSGETPLSQQTDEPLTSLLIPNRSLAALLERLVEKSDKAPEQSHTGKAASAGQNNSNSNRHSAANNNNNNTNAGDGSGHNNYGNHNNRGGNAINHNRDSQIEVNAAGERLHPCIRVYGFCNYKDTCAYAKYPYDACLSNLKGKCRFRNQCHERHVEFRGPLNDQGLPIEQDDASISTNTANSKEKPSVVTATAAEESVE